MARARSKKEEKRETGARTPGYYDAVDEYTHSMRSHTVYTVTQVCPRVLVYIVSSSLFWGRDTQLYTVLVQ